MNLNDLMPGKKYILSGKIKTLPGSRARFSPNIPDEIPHSRENVFLRREDNKFYFNEIILYYDDETKPFPLKIQVYEHERDLPGNKIFMMNYCLTIDSIVEAGE